MHSIFKSRLPGYSRPGKIDTGKIDTFYEIPRNFEKFRVVALNLHFVTFLLLIAYIACAGKNMGATR